MKLCMYGNISIIEIVNKVRLISVMTWTYADNVCKWTQCTKFFIDDKGMYNTYVAIDVKPL